jgi:exopolyphosphatase/guanosine-5'-triphosphate,3'-diphosphate pyrophosphatase
MDSISLSQVNRICAIDIGTNTILMLVADVVLNISNRQLLTNSILKIITDEQVIARLGKGVDQNKRILPETFTRVRDSLAEYKHKAEVFRCHKNIACGTSALRDAVNKKDFTKYIKKELGLDICILSSEQEAKFTYLGAIYEFKQTTRDIEFVVLDIGGGSTELTIGTGLNIDKHISIDIGTVRITERILKNSPPKNKQLQEAELLIKEQIHSLSRLEEHSKLIGVAGTVTTLAAIDLKLSEFDPVKVNGHILTSTQIKNISDWLKVKSSIEIGAVPQISKGREDVIVAGTLILLEIMNHIGKNEIVVSTKGLRYGMVLNIGF